MCSSMQAQRSRPAAPSVARWGNANSLPMRLSRILSSTFCMVPHGDFMDQHTGKCGLRSARQRLTSVAIDEEQLVVVRFEAETRSDAIDRDEIEPLRRELRARVDFELVGLRGKADGVDRWPPTRGRRQYVGVAHQFERQAFGGFLYFIRR